MKLFQAAVLAVAFLTRVPARPGELAPGAWGRAEIGRAHV